MRPHREEAVDGYLTIPLEVLTEILALATKHDASARVYVTDIEGRRYLAADYRIYDSPGGLDDTEFRYVFIDHADSDEVTVVQL